MVLENDINTEHNKRTPKRSGTFHHIPHISLVHCMKTTTMRFNRTSAKPAGSQLTELCCELNGIGSGPSPPTYPRANSLRLVEDGDTTLVGAKALAVLAKAAIVNKNFVMMGSNGKDDDEGMYWYCV